MPDHGDWNRVEPSVPEGTNAGLVSSSDMPSGMSRGTNGALSPGGMSCSKPRAANGNLVSPGGISHHSDSSAWGGLKGNAAGLVDAGKSKLASSLHDLGDRIEHRGRELEKKSAVVRPVGRVLDRTGNVLEGGANYLHTHDIDVISDDIVAGIRHHPLASAGVAVGVGWLLGRMIGGGESDEEGSGRAETRREPEQRDEPEPVRAEGEPGSSMFNRAKGRFAEVVASGIASVAARRIRDRIAGR